MRVFLSVDLEGVTGVTDVNEMSAGRDAYASAQRLMTADANAAIEGALAGGADEVVVCDSHNQARNLLVEELHPAAVLVRGQFKPARMMEGLDASFAAALFVGYHARAGSDPGVLNHTWIGKELIDVRIGGEPAGELHLNALVAGAHGVPVVLVTGDDVACREAEGVVAGVRTVAVKRAIDRFAAAVEHPSRTGPRIRAAAEEAVRARTEIDPLRVEGPVELAVEWASTHVAKACSLIPGVEQDGRVSRYRAPDVLTLRDVFVVMTTVAVATSHQPPYA